MNIKRDKERWDIRIIGECDTVDHTRKIKMIFIDISNEGFKAFVESDIKLQEIKLVEVKLFNGPGIKIKAQAVWKNKEGIYGFNVIDSSTAWKTLVENQTKVSYKVASQCTWVHFGRLLVFLIFKPGP